MNNKILLVVITVCTVVPIAVWMLVLFCYTIDLENIPGTVLRLSVEQVHYLLVLVTCVVLLFELSDASLTRHIIEDELLGFSAQRRRLSTLAWWLTASVLGVLGFLIPSIDLLGSFMFTTAEPSALAPKIALALLSGTYIYNAVQRPLLAKSHLKGILAQTGAMRVLSREEEYDFFMRALDDAPVKQRVLVTTFEEPRNPMHPEGYYYENDFMEKWYSTVRAKRLSVSQIILVNSSRDIAALELRLKLTKDLPLYSIAYIIAPRLTVFMDFMVMPGRFAILGFSDNRAVRNMTQFSLLVTSGPALERFEHLFTDILLPDAVHVKTFEGVDLAALEQLKSDSQTITKSGTRILREWFRFD